MKWFAYAGLALALSGVSAISTPARADASRAVTFQLQVSGRPARGMSYWVAYGPLGDRFGIVRLDPSGRSTYRATRVLPVHGRTVFVYLAAYGTIQTRLGSVPGPPVITVRRFGPIPAWQLPATVRWVAPVG